MRNLYVCISTFVILILTLDGESKHLRRATNTTTTTQASVEDSSDEYYEEGEYPMDDLEDIEVSGFSFLVRPTGKDANYSGLLIRESIVASLRLNNVATVSLCREQCTAGTLDATGQKFSFWRMKSKTSDPEVFHDSLAEAKCIANYDSNAIIFTVSGDKPICDACIDGDVILCDNEAAGIMTIDKANVQKLVTVEELVLEYEGLSIAQDKSGKKDEPKKHPDDDGSEKVRAQKSIGTVSKMAPVATILLFLVWVP